MLHVADEGAGTPVVLLHAYPCDHTMWDAQAAALVAAGYRVIRPDLPGFGGSVLPDGAEHSLTVIADAVFGMLDARDVGSFVLGGLSMGGYAAMQMLRQRLSVPQPLCHPGHLLSVWLCFHCYFYRPLPTYRSRHRLLRLILYL